MPKQSNVFIHEFLRRVCSIESNPQNILGEYNTEILFMLLIVINSQGYCTILARTVIT